MDQLEFRLSAIQSLAQAEKTLEQTKLLAREIDHRVMNSLQFVSGLLRMQGKTQEPSAAAQFELAANRVAAVARVHRHFHLEDDAAHANARAYIGRLCEDLAGILGVPITVHGDEGFLPTTAIQPVGLIVNELVTNAAKHGAGHISVTYKSGTVRQLIVCDQGPGIPPQFNPATSTAGLGMRVVQALASQLKGGVTATANPNGKGACFTVSFEG